jgi:hypothetical protein
MPTPLPGVPWTSGGVDDMTADIEARNDAAEESSGGGLSEAEVTAIAQAETATVVDSAPGLLNTLNEISAAIGDDPDFAAVVLGLIDEKAPLAGPYVKDYAEATRTAGDLTLNQTAVTAVNTGLDLTLTAAAGDLIRYGMDGIIGNEAQVVVFDVYTMVSGASVNPFGVGLSALGASQGVPQWQMDNIAQTFPLALPARRTLVAGDIQGGTVTLRLFYAKPNTTARTLFASSGLPLRVWAENLGPAT